MIQKDLFGRLRKWFLQGLALLAPLVITIAFLVWLGRSVELFMGDLMRVLIPSGWYLPGMGLAAGVALTLVAGLLANLFLVRWLLERAERVLDRIPLVKSLFQGLKDVSRFLANDRDEEVGRPVVVDIQGARLVGFVMQERAGLPGIASDGDLVAVYLPMSYQLGGFTLYLDRDRITQLDVGADRAMRAVLTGGSLGNGADSGDAGRRGLTEKEA
ncbi:DUF502 domain-containing protein [Thiorhodococcus fuscus]|uniref:DUF502 domain-containing protein n=1 Tax=Thiorhodococcus fuscus TaxID=527200 RepID=A0ABW4YB81_9GAMM